jgi:hypothetical protein
MAAFSNLNRLDDLWTLSLTEPGAISSEQADALNQITGEMRDILPRAAENAERLQGLIRQQQGAFDDAFQLVLRSTLVASLIDVGQRNGVDQVIQDEGGFASFAIKQLDIIRLLYQAEADTLEAKMAQIRTGGVTEGDLGRRFKCALLVGLLAASIAAMVSTGLVLVPTVVAAMTGGATASTIVNLFLAHHGANFILDAAHATAAVVHSIENCF